MENMSSVIEIDACIEDSIMMKPERNRNGDSQRYLSNHLRNALSIVNIHIALGNAKEAENEILNISNLLLRFGL